MGMYKGLQTQKIKSHTPSAGGQAVRKEEMKKQEIERRLQEILKELRMDNQEFYDQEAEKWENVKKHMTPLDMYAYKCGMIKSKIEWILTH